MPSPRPTGPAKCPLCEELYDALFMLMNYTGMTKFEPDQGEPHPLPDYAYDRAMRAAQLALAKARGEV